jgi:hypothetical protein
MGMLAFPIALVREASSEVFILLKAEGLGWQGIGMGWAEERGESSDWVLQVRDQVRKVLAFALLMQGPVT